MPHSQRPNGPVVLCILDGVGLGDGGPDDAVATARTPHLDQLPGPRLSLAAHGRAVGLPSDEDMGNSEVGHNALGSGKVVDQGAKRVDEALGTGAAFATPLWNDLTRARTLHLLGLVSDGNVHSHVKHLRALIEAAAASGVRRLRVHALTDGRDVAPFSALTWIEPLEAELRQRSAAGLDYRLASGGGRMHLTMDRYEADWAMVERGWRAHVLGEGRRFASGVEAIQTFYAEDPTRDDQWLPAFVVADGQGPVGTIEDGDAVLLFNFRGDRALQITRAFTEATFSAFDRRRWPAVTFAGMMLYDGDLALPPRYLVSPPTLNDTVGERLVRARRRTLAVAETQKFGHVTYFFNGNRSGRLDDQLESYVEVASDRAPFEERPWMKAAEVTDVAVAAILSGQWDHIRLNLANGDMVGHTGHLEATRLAVEAVDLSVGRLRAAVARANGVLLVTADHGNADQMWQRDKKGRVLQDERGPVPRTSHSLNPVPAWLFDPSGRRSLQPDASGSIARIGTTVLDLCGVPAGPDALPSLLA